jgi:hypothetical protein
MGDGLKPLELKLPNFANVISAYEAKQKPMTGSEYESCLDKAEKDLKNGRIISQEDLEKESKNW